MTSTGVPRPEIQMLLDLPAIAGREKDFAPTPEDPTAVVAALRATPPPAGDKFPLAEVWQFTAGEGGTRLRGYRPAVDEGLLPVLVYFHGGGWVFGSLDAHDAPCRGLANAGRCLVVSVDYKLAPEHPFPEPLEDCYAVTRWVVENAESFGGDPSRVGVGGGSSGANLAAAVALQAASNSGPRLLAQALFYPALDATTSSASFADNATGYNLSAAEMRFYWDCYRRHDESLTEPLLSPLHAPDLTGLPPASIHTAEFDVLRDEGEAYAARLNAAGIPAVVRRYDGQIHGFASLGAITPDAGHSLAEMGAWLDVALRA